MSPDDLLAAVESMTPAARTRLWRLLTGVESGSRVREPTVPVIVRDDNAKTADCPRCLGTGMVDVATQPPGKCARCAGEGEIVVRDDDGEPD